MVKLAVDNIGKFKVTYTATDTATISIKVGEYTYSSAATDLTSATATAITLTNDRNGTGQVSDSFILNIADQIVANNSIESQEDADAIAERINTAFENITFVQNRDIKSYKPGGNKVLVSGVEVGTLVDSSVNLISDSFEQVNVQSVKITAPGVGQTDATIEVKINGETYRSFAGIGSRIDDNTIIYLQNVDDSNKSLQIITGNSDIAGASNVGVALDLSQQSYADAIAAALENAFGVQDGKSVLNFQIGSAASDAIGVEITSAGSTDLFDGKILDITTSENANAASNALDVAIGRVTALRANIGALQSRFDYASANLETSIQNVDAARSTFLDANISEESTAFAQAQVKLQASISVLAQANLLPQNLLKLLG